MNVVIEKLRKDAMNLSVAERAQLAHELILSLDDDLALEPEKEKAISRRIIDITRNKHRGISADRVFAKVKSRYA